MSQASFYEYADGAEVENKLRVGSSTSLYNQQAAQNSRNNASINGGGSQRLLSGVGH
jgi:hypothetical protein